MENKENREEKKSYFDFTLGNKNLSLITKRENKL